MFVVREFIQECGSQTKELVRESSFDERDEAETFLRVGFETLLSEQKGWPDVWSQSFESSRYTIDNCDGDFFCGVIACEEAS